MMKRTSVGRRALAHGVLLLVVVLLPVPAAATAPAETAERWGIVQLARSQAAFLATEAGGDAAAEAAEDIGTEASGEQTGVSEGDDAPVPSVPGANPPEPDPGTDVIGSPPVPPSEPYQGEPARGPPPAEIIEPSAPHEVITKRTARSKTIDNGDGSFTLRTFAEPVHVWMNGYWVDIDTELHQADDGTIVNGPALVGVELAADGAADALVELDLGEVAMSYGLAGAASVEPEVSGSTAVYEEVLPGVDLELESVRDGLKETVVLAGPEVASALSFPLDIGGGTAELDGDGGIVITEDATGEVTASIPPGFMVDSGPDGGARSDAVDYQLEEVDGQAILRVTPDRAWLDDPARVWPVRVDPTTVKRTPFDDTYVKQGVTADHTGHAELRVGPEGGALTAAYMKFFLNIGSNHYITAATLDSWNSYSAGGCTAKPVGVYRVTQSWTGSSMQSWPGASYSSAPYATGSFAKGGGAGCPSGWVSWNVKTLVQEWVNGTHPNHGLTLRVPSQNATDPGTGKKFGAGSANHELQIDYTPYGAVYDPGGDWYNGDEVKANEAGRWPVYVRNAGSATWPAGTSVRLGARIFESGTWNEVSGSGARTPLPNAVAPGETVYLGAHLPALPPGDYDVFWDMVKEGEFWFSQQGVVGAATTIRVRSWPAQITWAGPKHGQTAEGNRPIFSAGADDPDDHPGGALQFFFRVCPGPNPPPAFPSAHTGCQSSGWQTHYKWSPPNPLLYGQKAYWWAFVRDATLVQTTFEAPSMIIPRPAQPDDASAGRSGSPAVDGGVDLATGGYSAASTDASVGTGDSALGIVRTYNSQAYTRDGAFGRGWASILDISLVTIEAGSTPQPDIVEIRRADGVRERWGRNETSSLVPWEDYSGPHGNTGSLYWSHKVSRFSWLTGDGWHYTFAADGALEEVVRPDQSTISIERHPTTGKAVRIQDDTTGVGLDVEWTGDLVTAVETDPVTPGGSDGLRWTYTYGGPTLTQVCDPRPAPEQGCVTYRYRTMTGSGVWGGPGPVGPLEGAGSAAGEYLQLGYSFTFEIPSVSTREDGEGNLWSYAPSTDDCTHDAESQCRYVSVTQPSDDHLAPGSPAPQPVVYEVDAAHRLMRRIDELGNVASWEYDLYGFPLFETDENDVRQVFLHNEHGRLIAHVQQREGGANPVTPTTYYEYPTNVQRDDPRWMLPVRVWDPREMDNHTEYTATRLTYDEEGRLLSRRTPTIAEAPAGRTESYTYHQSGNGIGQVATHTDVAGRVTAYEYWPGGALREVTRPSGAVTQLAYDGIGRVVEATEVTDSGPDATITMEYDGVGNVVAIEEPTATNLVTTTSATGRTTMRYDSARRLVEQVEHGSGSDADRVTEWTDFDGNGRPTEVVDPAGEVTTTSWTWRGHQGDVDHPNGTRLRHHYTATGLPARVTAFDLQAPGTTAVLSAVSYDPAGRMASSVGASGDITSYTYYDDGRLKGSRLTNYRAGSSTIEGRQIASFTYDLAGNLRTSVSRHGTLATTYTFNRANDLTRVETAGRYTAYTYRTDGLLGAVTKGDATTSESTSYGYAPLPTKAQTSMTVTPGGAAAPLVTQYEWDDRGLLTAEIAPGGRRTDVDYDVLARPVRVTGPATTVESFGSSATTTRPEQLTGYNAFGEATHTRAPDGTVQDVGYDALGRVESVELPPYTPLGAPASLTPRFTYAYDTAGRTVSSTDDLRDATTVQELDFRGRTVARIDPPIDGSTSAGTTLFTYDAGSRVTGVQGPEGAVATAGYDTVGNLIWATAEDRFPTARTSRTDYSYDAELDLRTVTTAEGGVTSYGNNAFGEVTSVTEPSAGGGPITTTIERDMLGRASAVTDALGRSTRRVLDGAGRLVEQRELQGSTTLRTRSFGYDAAGDLTSVTKPAPNPGGAPVTTTMAYTGAGQVSSITEPGGITTSFGYDALGRRTRVSDGNGEATWHEYTPWGDVERTIDPATTAHPTLADRSWTYRYDAPGRAITSTAPGGVTAQYQYDGLGQLASQTGTGGDADVSLELEWDRAGRLLEATSPTSSDTFTWDDRGNLLTADGTGGTSSFTYDGNGRMTGRTDAAGAATFTYWPGGQLKTTSGGGAPGTTQHSYDAAGQIDTITSGTTVRDFQFDGLGNPTSESIRTWSSPNVEQTWSWAPDGEHLTSTTTGPAVLAGAGTTSYTYDAAGRLATTTAPGAAATTTTWDGAGNRTSDGARTFAYDERNRLTSYSEGPSTTDLDWTPRGTLDQVTTGASTVDFAFDALDRLITVTDPQGATTTTWDALGRIATADGEEHAYAGLERDPVSVGDERMTRDPGGLLRAVKVGTEPSRFTRSDHRGDITATYRPGALTPADTSRTYTPHGVATESGTAAGQPGAGYQGDWTTDGGLVHMDARFYNPATGTFLTRDSWNLGPTTAAAINRYTYGAANPVTVNDPTGHATPGNCRGNGTPIVASRPPATPFGFDHCDRRDPPKKIGNGGGGPPNCIGRCGNDPGPGPGPGQGSGDGCSRRCGSNVGGGGGGNPGGIKPAPRYVRPNWTVANATTPPPGSHLVPANANGTRPTVEVSDTLHRDPTAVTAGFSPTTAGLSAVLLDSGSEEGGFDVGKLIEGLKDGVKGAVKFWEIPAALKDVILNAGDIAGDLRELFTSGDWSAILDALMGALGLDMESCREDGYSYCIGVALGEAGVDAVVGGLLDRIIDAVRSLDRLPDASDAPDGSCAVGMALLPTQTSGCGNGGDGDDGTASPYREYRDWGDLNFDGSGIDDATQGQINALVDVADANGGRLPDWINRGGGPQHIFQNKEGELPVKPAGYYREADVFAMAPSDDWTYAFRRRPERLVFGSNGEVYYTGDHYKTFTRLR
jgi:RHS repeat-associated protein